MRKFFVGLGVTVLIIVGVGFGLSVWTKNSTSTTAQVVDLLNPFVREETVYVKTTRQYDHHFRDSADGTTNYAYNTTSYNAQGNPRQLQYTAFGRKVRAGHYLKITTKGQDVRQWAAVSWNEIPSKAQDHLK